MAHYCTAVFHSEDADVESIMSQYYNDTEDSEFLEFNLEFTAKQAKMEFNKHKKENIDIPCKNVKDYMENFLCYRQNFDGDWGYLVNPNGLHDGFQVGGRWENILFPKLSKEKLKKFQDSELKNTRKFKLLEYVELKMMTPLQFCQKKNIEGKISLGKITIKAKDLSVVWTLKLNKKLPHKPKKINDLFDTVICEETGIREGYDFMELLKYWKTKDGKITVVDYHQ